MGYIHVTSSPYHPSSNELAERAVQIVKRDLKIVTSGNKNSQIAQVLFTHHITLRNTTWIYPAEIFLGRQLHTKLNLIRPNTIKVWRKSRMLRMLSMTIQQRPKPLNWVTKSMWKTLVLASHGFQLGSWRSGPVWGWRMKELDVVTGTTCMLRKEMNS